MATIVNNPQPATTEGSGAGGLVAGIIIALIVVLLFLFVALPAIRNAGTGTNVQVPEQIDVNVQPQAQ